MGPQRLARENNITITEAKQFIEDYFTAYPTIKEYSEKCCETARNTGYASTISGRQRPVPEINSRNRGHQINGEHIALNTPIQGSAADIIKMAMIKIDERLEKELPDAVMICQIHDELVFEAAPEQAEKLIEIIKDCMENVIDLSVPLKVDVGMGKNWFEAH
jgi:DNA polymerase-1